MKTIVSPAASQALYLQVRSVCHRRYTQSDSGMTLLHLCVDYQTEVNDYHIKNICKCVV